MQPILTVFGASGRTGRALIAAAAPTWRIRGFVRPGSEFPGVELVTGTFSDAQQMADAVAGATAVCCVFGQRPPYGGVFCEAATQAIVAAMRAVGCDRMVCQTGAMIGSGQGLRRSRSLEWVARTFERRHPAIARDRVGQERMVMESGLRWTVVKPPRLTDGRARGRVRAGPDLSVGLLSSIRRADLAAFLLEEAEDCRFLRSRVVVKG